MSEQRPFDVIVVGAGAAGAATASVLVRAGLRIALVDREPSTAPCFKAEKVEPDQAQLLRELGLFDALRQVLTPIRTVATAYRGRVLQRVEIEQYGVNYWELADALRAVVPESVAFRIAPVRQIAPGPEHQRVVLADGSVLESRLVVLASGTSPGLIQQLAIERREIDPAHSLAFGFDVQLERPLEPFDSLTYLSEGVSTRIDFVTLFPIGSRCRANLFTYFALDDPRVRQMRGDASLVLSRELPRLRSIVGTWSAVGKVETQVIDLYAVDGPVSDGLVLISDAHQAVCPATGTGLSKALTDVKVVCEHIQTWLRTPGMPRQKIASYYEDPRKRETDSRSLAWAAHRRSFSTDTSLRWRVHRTRSYVGMALGPRLRRAGGGM